MVNVTQSCLVYKYLRFGGNNWLHLESTQDGNVMMYTLVGMYCTLSGIYRLVFHPQGGCSS
jgi:hypothetical protein